MKKTCTQFIALIMVIFTMTNQVQAQSQFGILYGMVSDEEIGEAVPFASLAIKSPNGKLVAAGVSNLDGNFEIDSIPSGKYSVEVSFLGYETKEFTDFPIKAGKNELIVFMQQDTAVVMSCCFCCCFVIAEEVELEEPISEAEQQFLLDSKNRDLIKDGYFIYPNPANDILHFQFMEDVARIQFTDLNGKVLYDAEATKYEENSLLVAAYPAGMYVLRYFTAGKWESKKIMVLH